MEQWSPTEVLEFIVKETQLNLDNESVKRFECISGYIFMTLSEEYCKLLANSDRIGAKIFNVKEKYLRCHPCNGKFVNLLFF